MNYTVPLPRLGTWPAWRDAARALASNAVHPDDVNWTRAGDASGLFDGNTPLPQIGPKPLSVSKAFMTLGEQVTCHRAKGTFDLLYRLLLALTDKRGALSNRADPLVARAEELAKNIRRDRHKMRAFVRFREVTEQGANRRSFVAWFEPDHRIEELNASFFARRFADMDWAIVTPEVTTKFALGETTFHEIAAERPDLSDETEELWRTYYANIFNPARLKIKAMQSEMPKKYWKNLPEADLIPGLIADAEARMMAMRETAPTLPPVRAGRILDALPELQNVAGDGALDGLQGCARCPLGQMATQAVGGEGPHDAPLMIVGEQPGDQEDLAGQPFVGPAGQLFDRLAAQAGLDRNAAYVTNAVKHFKFQPRGKRRIHASPNASEVHHCRWWLERERAAIKPALTVALGATAALALTGDGKAITKRRGTVETGLDGGPVFITFHPSAALRGATPQLRESMEHALCEDLKQIAEMLRFMQAETATL